jgi:translocation and assembly module TamB
VTLQNGRFSLPDTTKKTTTTVNASLSEEAASIRRINTPRLRNLEVYLGERVTLTQSPVLRVDPQGTLVFNGTFDRPEPRGEVRFVRGRLNLFPVPFYLDNSQTSVARFRPELGLNPELDILAYARATEVNTAGSGFLPTNTLKSNSSNPFINEQIVRITARVTGRASKPEIELRSSPPRSRDEIIALLGGSNPILGTGVAFVGSPILTPLEDFFLENLGLDIFTISPTTRTLPSSPGAIALGLGLEVGKDINRDFSLSISQSLTDPSQQTRLSVRYRLSDEVQLRLSTDFKRDVSFSIEYDTRF